MFANVRRYVLLAPSRGSVGRAKTHTFDRRPLDPIAPTVIPPGHVYVQGTSADSFDSRYRSSGLVSTADVVARVRPLLWGERREPSDTRRRDSAPTTHTAER